MNTLPDLFQLASEVHRRLLEFYGQPTWRNPLPPVDELVSTILSQNTNDINRDRAFESLRQHFPTWEAVRDANPDSIVAAIRMAKKYMYFDNQKTVQYLGLTLTPVRQALADAVAWFRENGYA